MQKSRVGRFLLMGAWVCMSSLQAQDIHLKTRTMNPSSSVTTEQGVPNQGVPDQGVRDQGATEQRPTRQGVTAQMRAGQQAVHQIVQFDHAAGAADLAALVAAGGQVTGALPDNAVVVASRGELTTRATGAHWIGPLEAQDKVSPALRTRLRTGRNDLAIVEFHSDITVVQQDTVEARTGAVFLRPPVLMARHVIVQTSPGEITKLAEQDEVAYIFPADPGLLSGVGASACAGMLTTAGEVAQYANVTHGWDEDSDHVAHLTYFFGSLTPKVPSLTVQGELVRALQAWANGVNVAFSPGKAANAARSIYFEFVSGAHGDAYPFDGPGGALAHTFYPVPVNGESIAGDMHLDADERWNVGGDIDIYSVALHEAGHAIGLTHSDKPGDVMYPYYRRGMSLSANDIGAAQQLYPGAPTPPDAGTVSTAPVLTTTVPPTPLALTVDTVASATQAVNINFTGTATGGTSPVSVQWQTNHGAAGNAVVSTLGAWTAAAVPLVTGPNVVTLTAFDSADDVVTQTSSVTKVLPPSGTSSGLPLAISITSPVSPVVTVSSSTLSISGKASGGSGITNVTWQTSTGASGIATGVGPWVASGIPLYQGTTTIVLRAFDSSGASAWVALVAVRP